MATEPPVGYDSAVSPRTRDVEAMVAFGRVVRRLRRAQDWTQAELAERAQVERETLGRIERGLREPGLSVIIRLALALATTPAQLMKAMEEERER